MQPVSRYSANKAEAMKAAAQGKPAILRSAQLFLIEESLAFSIFTYAEGSINLAGRRWTSALLIQDRLGWPAGLNSIPTAFYSANHFILVAGKDS